MKLTITILLATLGLTAPAGAATIFLNKPEAKRQATGYARHVCNDLDDCTDAFVENSYTDCRRIRATLVDCEVIFEFSDGVACTQTVRVRETTRSYFRKLVYSPDCE